jgi:hypothetical protein
MKTMFQLLLLFVSVLSSSCATAPRNREDVLADNLGFLYAVVYGTNLNTKYCSERFPALAPDLNSAYDDWKNSSPMILQEVESGWQEMKQLASKNFGRPLAQVEADTNNLLSRQAQAQKQQLEAGSIQDFERRCKNHLVLLRDPRTDIERRYPIQVAAMRQALRPK